MQFAKLLPALFGTLLLASIPAVAQLRPTEPDPLARIRDAAAANVQACSVTGETLCEQVAPKIIANAQGDSPLAENLRNLRAALATKNQTIEARRATAWAMAAFREAGLDAHIEKYPNPDGGLGEQQVVVAEYRGREKPDEWVLVGAHVAPRSSISSANEISCDAASVVEAARDISVTAMHPKWSIRFAVFTGDKVESWAYLHAHRKELDHVRAAILFHSYCYRVSGYSLNGRRDIEAGLHDAMKPIDFLGASHFVFGVSGVKEDLDFLLEGIPTLSASPDSIPISLDGPMPEPKSGKTGLADLKYNIAVVAVTAFGIAERTVPIGPRQSHAEIESLLETLGVNLQMKAAGTWQHWESGERGRLP